jgi:hypothetical protein
MKKSRDQRVSPLTKVNRAVDRDCTKNWIRSNNWRELKVEPGAVIEEDIGSEPINLNGETGGSLGIDQQPTFDAPHSVQI